MKQNCSIVNGWKPLKNLGRMSERSETTTENWITCFGKLSLSNKQLLAKIRLGAWKSIISSYFGGFSPFWNETCPSQMVDHLPQFNHVGFETTGCHLLRFGRWQICNMRDIHNTLRLRRMSPWPPTAKNLVVSDWKTSCTSGVAHKGLPPYCWTTRIPFGRKGKMVVYQTYV